MTKLEKTLIERVQELEAEQKPKVTTIGPNAVLHDAVDMLKEENRKLKQKDEKSAKAYEEVLKENKGLMQQLATKNLQWVEHDGNMYSPVFKDITVAYLNRVSGSGVWNSSYMNWATVKAYIVLPDYDGGEA